MTNKSGRLAVEESDGFVKRRLIDWGDSRFGEHVGVTPTGVTGTAAQGMPVKLVDETGAAYGSVEAGERQTRGIDGRRIRQKVYRVAL